MQQELQACRPVLTPKMVTFVYSVIYLTYMYILFTCCILFSLQIISIWWIITIILIPIGVALLTASENVCVQFHFFLIFVYVYNYMLIWNCYYYQVVEIVRRYDTDCVHEKWTTAEKIAFIQSRANKTCTIELQVFISLYLFSP
jgi:hypothetical protein